MGHGCGGESHDSQLWRSSPPTLPFLVLVSWWFYSKSWYWNVLYSFTFTCLKINKWLFVIFMGAKWVGNNIFRIFFVSLYQWTNFLYHSCQLNIRIIVLFLFLDFIFVLKKEFFCYFTSSYKKFHAVNYKFLRSDLHCAVMDGHTYLPESQGQIFSLAPC